MKKKLSVLVISITTFDEQGRVDEAAFRKHLGRLRAAGVSVWVAGSGSSEGYSLNPEERERVLAIAVEELKGKVPVRAMGCEPRLISEMLDFMRCAERAKVDAAQIFSLDIGHGTKPTAGELEKYYSTVIESTSLPIVLSSHQASGYFLPLDLVERLANRFPNLMGINYGGTDTTHLADIIERFGDRLEVHCAGPNNALSTLCLGGNGFMGGEGNFSPLLVASVICAYETGNLELLRASFAKLMAFTRINNRYGGSSMRGMKPLLNAFGLPGGALRSPRLPISAADAEVAVREVLKLDLPGIPPLKMTK